MSDTSHEPATAQADTTPGGPPGGLRRFATARSRSLLGALFLMATSAIGPGFITQTATFTQELGAAFAFGILVSILLDLAVQMNVWRMITLTGKRASVLANEALRGSGYVLAVLIVFGGLIFNIGNTAGAGLGLNALFGLDPRLGGAISAAIAIAIFLAKRAGAVVDRVVIVAGLVMIVLTVIVAILSGPPVGEALRQTVLPDTVDFATITTIVGGTVGGYITYAGAHKLLDSGTAGPEHIREVDRAAVSGILVTGVMRYVLFLAILGVVASGVVLDVTGNPAGDAFGAAAGEAGLRIFGAVFWIAAITSVIGSAYTSVSFLPVFSARITGRTADLWTVGFILVSLAVYLLIGTAPATLLVFVGGVNGLILPIGLTLFMYIGWFRGSLLGSVRYPRWLLVVGTLATVVTWYMAVNAVGPIFDLLSA
ncbi:NRAMP family divalent metal transporter [Promicromonospora thailandica]|uniref:Mn2+ and Fe2+ transporters of the NRAMP family n=1 Tax=Promicromonospora thailandica TaxID=765201 RepID=A0A9X2G6H6_9MICO|nr:NRAMP family divalent metal transporter [Promicromonospora thailandica]MCP2266473.1 Mn2+ and Fe2+ transporters of the NRAMP family [Promicromonospora thailandica]